MIIRRATDAFGRCIRHRGFLVHRSRTLPYTFHELEWAVGPGIYIVDLRRVAPCLHAHTGSGMELLFSLTEEDPGQIKLSSLTTRLNQLAIGGFDVGPNPFLS